MELLDDKYPKEDKIRIVLDNLKVHTSEATRKYLATVSGRFEYKTKYYILESTAALAMRCNSIILGKCKIIRRIVLPQKISHNNQ